MEGFVITRRVEPLSTEDIVLNALSGCTTGTSENTMSQPLPSIVADPSQAKYDIRATHDAHKYPDLEAALAAPIKTFAIEFLRFKEKKPHPWFVVTFEQPIPGTLGTYRKASVNMEMAEGGRGPGICLIRLLGDHSSGEHISLAGFAFTVRSIMTLRTISDVMAGRHQSSEELEQTGDLMAFSYVQSAAHYDFWRGDRDWLAQVFCRLETHELVGTRVIEVLGPGRDLGMNYTSRPVATSAHAPCRVMERAIDWNSAFFDDIADLVPLCPTISPLFLHGGPMAYYDKLPLSYGTFLDPAVQPTKHMYIRSGGLVQERTLPYLD